MEEDISLPPLPFGPYWLLERLAIGGMAEVYLARATEGAAAGQLVAVKRILPGIAEQDDFIAMFIDEAKIAGQLLHPNIVRVIDLGERLHIYYMVMEYVSGLDLREVWERAREVGGMSLAMACDITAQLCAGLHYAHERRDGKGQPLHIVHRDVSPQNVLLSYAGDVKLIDFGIAKVADRVAHTQTGILKGKFAYMSPEQARGDAADHRSDVFAVGVILYELLTGERAFRAESDYALLDKVRRVDIVPPRARRASIPKELERIVLRAMAAAPDDRYPTAAALAEDLEGFMRQRGLRYPAPHLSRDLQAWFADEWREESERLARYQALSLPPKGGDEEALATPTPDNPSFVPPGASLDAPVRPRGRNGTLALKKAPILVSEIVTASGRARRGQELHPPVRGEPYPSDDDATALEHTVVESSDAHPRAGLSSASTSAAGESSASIFPGEQRRPSLDEPPQLESSSAASQGRPWPMRDDVAPRRVSWTHLGLATALGAVLASLAWFGGAGEHLRAEANLLIATPSARARVEVLGREVCSLTPCGVYLPPGRHELRFSGQGFAPVWKEVRVPADGAVLLELPLRALRTVHVESEPPGARVFVDGVPIEGVTPLAWNNAGVGDIVGLRVELAGYRPHMQDVTVSPEEVTRVSLRLEALETRWMLDVEPVDAVITPAGARGEVGPRVFRIPLGESVGFAIARPGCRPRVVSLSGNGRTEAAEEVRLSCAPFDSALFVTAANPMRLEVDGHPTGLRTPVREYALPSGPHVVALRRGKKVIQHIVVTSPEVPARLDAASPTLPVSLSSTETVAP